MKETAVWLTKCELQKLILITVVHWYMSLSQEPFQRGQSVEMDTASLLWHCWLGNREVLPLQFPIG